MAPDPRARWQQAWRSLRAAMKGRPSAMVLPLDNDFFAAAVRCFAAPSPRRSRAAWDWQGMSLPPHDDTSRRLSILRERSRMRDAAYARRMAAQWPKPAHPRAHQPDSPSIPTNAGTSCG